MRQAIRSTRIRVTVVRWQPWDFRSPVAAAVVRSKLEMERIAMRWFRHQRQLTISLFGLATSCAVITTIGCSQAEQPSAVDARSAPAGPMRAEVVEAVSSGRVGPQAEIVEKQFDFGMVEPLRTHEHTFEIHNRGTAPLTLAQQGTTCKCLELASVSAVVPPGGIGKVVVAWHAKAAQDVFVQRASVATNDPHHQLLEFKVLGQSLLLVATDPPQLVAPRIKPDESASIDATIFSQVLDEFTVEDLTTSLDGLQWELSPASRRRLTSLNAKSGWNLHVVLPDNLPQGGFRQWLRFRVEPVNHRSQIDPDLLSYEVPVQGKVLRRLSVFGESIDFDGTVDLGIVNAKTGAEKVLTVRVHDSDQRLNVTSTTTEPRFVEAHLEQFPGPKDVGIYRLRLRIPPNATPGYYRREHVGKLVLRFDHPRIDSLELGLSFVVPNDGPSRLHQVGMTEREL